MPALDRRLHPVRKDLAADFLRDKVDAPRYAPAVPMRIASPLADLRPKPDAACSIDTQALYGEIADVFEVAGEWAWLQLRGDSYVGYVKTKNLGPLIAPASHRIACLATPVYPVADIKAPHIKLLPRGALLTVESCDEKFAKIEGGFVYGAHLDSLNARESDFVAVAEKFIGAPYLWGGKSAFGLDCSALVQISLAACGIFAPRDSDLQAQELGQSLDFEEGFAGLKRGDLIFWGGHVAIMQNAERLIHANGHHMCVASEFLRPVAARIEFSGAGPVTAIRRLF